MSALIKSLVVIDTNVFISGTLFGGVPRQVLDRVQSDRVTLLVSQLLATEILIQLRTFQVEEATYRAIEYLLFHQARMLWPKPIRKISRDPKDDMLLALSLAGNAEHLITGDKDLLILKKFGKTQIVTPKEFLLFSLV